MNKKSKSLLDAALDKALAPPRPKNKAALDSLLSEYDDTSSIQTSNPDQTQTNTKLHPDQTQTRPRPIPNSTQTRPRPAPKQKNRKAPKQSGSNLISISPQKDFNKRANSLDRDALPMGVFLGSSKKLYDALYIRTVGAITPSRQIQATRKDIMEWTGIKNIKTINSHIKNLKQAGLIKQWTIAGEREGAFFEIYLPEEIGLEIDAAEQVLAPESTQTRPRPDPDQKLVLDPDQKLVWVGLGQTIDSKGTYGFPKTFINTYEKNDDDDAFGAFLSQLKETVKLLGGKEPSKAEEQKWKEVAEILCMELTIAASRTETISNIPAFFAEHLRRRLFKKDKRQMEAAMGAESKKVKSGAIIDSRECPDCKGTNFYYPNGYDKGVEKCKHEKLTSTAEE